MNNRAKLFKALGDEKRQAVLELIKEGERCACVLLEELDLTQSGLSYHMKILDEAGLISCRPQGKWVYYSVAESAMELVVSQAKACLNPSGQGHLLEKDMEGKGA